MNTTDSALEQIIARGNRPLAIERIREPQVDNWLVCADGFKLSVIAGGGAYCIPRGDDGPFIAVEVGYPSAKPEPWQCTEWSDGFDAHAEHADCDGWAKYAESPDEADSSVYGYVPVQMVRDLVNAHGGVA